MVTCTMICAITVVKLSNVVISHWCCAEDWSVVNFSTCYLALVYLGSFYHASVVSNEHFIYFLFLWVFSYCTFLLSHQTSRILLLHLQFSSLHHSSHLWAIQQWQDFRGLQADWSKHPFWAVMHHCPELKRKISYLRYQLLQRQRLFRLTLPVFVSLQAKSKDRYWDNITKKLYPVLLSSLVCKRVPGTSLQEGGNPVID